MYSQDKLQMVLQIYSLIRIIIVGLNHEGVNFLQFSLILHKTNAHFFIKIDGKYQDLLQLIKKP